MARPLLYFSREYTTHDRRFLQALVGSGQEGPDGRGVGGWEVYFLRLERDGTPYESRPLPEGVQAVEWEGGRGLVDGLRGCLELLPAYQKVVDHLEPAVIQAGPIQTCGLMAAVTGGAPLLAVSWGSDMLVQADKDALHGWATRKVLEVADGFFCDSATVLEKARRFARLPEEAVVRFPWGTDLRAFTPGTPNQRKHAQMMRARLGWEQKRVVLSTRAWETVHGVETLMEGFVKAHRKNPDLRLLLAATGSRQEWVKGFLKEHRLEEAVHSTGQLSESDMPDLFRMADIYVSCAHTDGTSVSLLEALATALPVIVTDIPSNREWVMSGQHGWLVEAGDSAGVAEALLSVSSLTSEQQVAIARRNREIAEARGDWFRNVEQLRAMLDRLATRSAGVRR